METEWEATFWPVDKDAIREQLRSAGAIRIYPERLMRRVNLHLPNEKGRMFARVRDEGDRITMAVKDMSGTRIEEQKEVEVVVDDFERARSLLHALGCTDKNYQETRRKRWQLDGVDITIDEWPFLEPFIEIEGKSEALVRSIATKLGYPWEEARFCAADTLYAERYGIQKDDINLYPRLIFEGRNPFQK